MYGRRIQDLHIAYEQKSKASVLAPGAGEQLQLHTVIMHNRFVGASDLGLLIKLGPTGYLMGLLQGGSAVADITAAIQAGSTQDVFTTANNDGFLIQSAKRFNLIGLEITQAQGAGTPVYAYQYYNGTSYVALTDIIESPNFSSTGSKLLVFSAPRDWVPGSTGAVGGNSGMYSIRAIATTAPAQAVQANEIWVGKFLHFQAQVTTNGNLSITFPYEQPKLLDGGEGVLPYFSNADAKNLVTALYQSV